MKPVLMTIIKTQKEYWPSRESKQGPPILKSSMLSTELCRLGLKAATTRRLPSHRDNFNQSNFPIPDGYLVQLIYQFKWPFHNPFPNDKILDSSKAKSLHTTISSLMKMAKISPKAYKSLLGKATLLITNIFFPFSTVFSQDL